MTTRTQVLQYIIDEYLNGDTTETARISGYSKAQVDAWLSGKREPQKITIQYILQRIFIPEFKVIAEFAEFDPQAALQTQLKKLLGQHTQDPGIYAFYDSMGNLIYLGKATRLIAEITAAINRTVHIAFPKGVKNAPKVRTQIVRYISAYDVGTVKWNDFPKHVEALILRISKPSLNKNIGNLESAHKAPKET